MKGELKKRTLDWLWSAIKVKSGLQIISISDDCAVATDGVRLHAINSNMLPAVIDDMSVRDVLNLFNRGSTVSQISVNPEYLIDALRGFSFQVDITLVDMDNKKGIIVTSEDNDKEAFIMCMSKGVENEH